MLLVLSTTPAMSFQVFLLQLQELRSCCCQTKESHIQNQCAELAREYLGSVDATTAASPILVANNVDSYNFPLKTHEQVFAFNQRLRKMPLQMELHMCAITELHRAATDLDSAFSIIFQAMFTEKTLLEYNWFGNNKMRCFRNFGAITELMELSAKEVQQGFNLTKLQKLFNKHVYNLQRQQKRAVKILPAQFKDDFIEEDYNTVIRYIDEDMYPIVLTQAAE